MLNSEEDRPLNYLPLKFTGRGAGRTSERSLTDEALADRALAPLGADLRWQLDGLGDLVMGCGGGNPQKIY